MKEAPLHNSEGMWTLDNLPSGRMAKLHGFVAPKGWSEAVMHSCVRFNTGGSGSFVSPNGLVITNHHVAETTLNDLRTDTQDFITTGFLAEKLEDEVPAKQLEVNVLQEIVDVTARVEKAITGLHEPEAVEKAKRAIIAEIEAESKRKTGLRSDVVTLYQGGVYHLYLYKRYTDVRFVFAPEKAIASLGGDIDNYTFPRYCLDIAFFRVYENGKPLKTSDYFRWSKANATEGELLFVAGHPGKTDRMSTVARVKTIRDRILPWMLGYLYRQEVMVQQFSGQNKRNRKIAEHQLDGIQNYRKRLEGQLVALADPHFMSEFAMREDSLRGLVGKDATLSSCLTAWDAIEKAERHSLRIRDEYNLFEGGLAFSSTFFGLARTIVRLAEENNKPNAERLEEYQDARRESLLHQLLSPAPIYPEFEQWGLASSLTLFGEMLGFDHASVREVLGDMSPSERAYELVNTKLSSVEYRKKLIDGGKTAVKESFDPFIKLALLVDERARQVRRDMKENVEIVREIAYAEIARARFAVYGTDLYPDATFTLRLTYGSSLGYVENGVNVPHATKIGGIFGHAEKHDNEGDWKLPESWKGAEQIFRNSGNENADYNFVTTHDVHGGNSGSPVFNEALQFVGILFDGNISANARTFLYRDTTERSVSVHAAGITAALAEIYHAERLLAELLPR